MKRTFSLLISIALLLTGGIASAATSEFYATPGEPYEETVTVTSVRVVDPDYVSFDEGDDIENNLWTRYYLEEHNLAVKYLWTVPEADTYTEKVNMQMLGELPDFLKMNANQYEQALEAGLLADITEAYETYASPALKERMTLTGGGVLEAGSKDGKLYALVQETDWQSNSAPILFIRGDWMEKLGLEAPKSVEDLMNIARAFATQDPDGNGKDDTYGICIDQYYNLSYFFPMFNAYNGIWLEKEDGTYGYSSVQPEMREALQQMQTYYKEGIFKPDYLTSTTNAQDLNTGKCGIFINNYVWPLIIMDGWESNPELWWNFYPLPTVDGENYPAAGQAPNGYSEYWVVSKDCEHPEALIKLMNTFVDLQTNDSSMLHDADGRPVYLYNAAAMNTPDNNYINYKLICDALESGDTSVLPVQAVQAYEFVTNYINGSTAKNDWAYYYVFGPEGTQTVAQEYYIEPSNWVRDAWGISPTEGMVAYESSLTDLEKQYFSRILMGEDIALFDEFVASWNAMGGETITAEVNAALAK